MSTNRPNHPCQNPACGCTLFTAAYENGVVIWQCCNCAWPQPRQCRTRRTNHRIALDLWEDIRQEWADTDEELRKVVDLGVPSGCLLVYSSAFNYHLDKLLMLAKPSSWEVKHHAAQARADLQRAKDFIKSDPFLKTVAWG